MTTMRTELQITAKTLTTLSTDSDKPQTLSWLGDIGRDLILNEMVSKRQLAFEDLDLETIFSVVASLLKSPQAKDIYFLLPNKLNNGKSDLPSYVWFYGDVGAARNTAMPAGKKVKITAIVGNPASADTMRLITKINKALYLANESHEIWLQRFLQGDTGLVADQLSPSPEDERKLVAAIGGFLLTDPLSLDLAVRYLRRVRSLMVNGNNLLDSFGKALPTLNLPKDARYFDSLKNPCSAQDWKSAFDKLYEERAGIVTGYLAQNILLKEDLEEKIPSLEEKLADKPEILDLCKRAASDPSNSDVMVELLNCDWEDDLIGFFLTSKNRRDSRSSMAERTKEIIQQYYSVSTNEDNETLKQILDYLDDLKTREHKRGAATENDIVFFNKNTSFHHDETLVNKWSKFIYPNDYECEDFAEGLLKATNALFSADLKQSRMTETNRRLSISFQAKQFKAYTEKVREEMMLYFSILYRDFRDALGEFVVWETDYSTSVDPLFDWKKWVDLKKIEVNTTKKRGEHTWALKFVISEIELSTENGVPVKKETGRKKHLVWKFSPDSLACFTNRFLCGETEEAFVNCAAANPLEVMVLRSPNDSGRKGVISKATLTNASSLYQSGRKIRTVDADKIIREHLNERKSEISPQFFNLYENFTNTYRHAVENIQSKGFEYASAAEVRKSYDKLMKEASRLPSGHKTRSGILSPLLAIGTMRSTVGEKVFEIIPPWHPLRMYEIARHHQDAAYAIRCIISGDHKTKIGGEYLSLLKQEAAQPSSPLMTISLAEDLTSGQEASFPVEHNHWYTLCSTIDKGNGDIKTERNTDRAVSELIDAIESYQAVEGPLYTDVKVLQICAEDPETNQLLKKKQAEAINLDVELTLHSDSPEAAARLYNTLTNSYNRNSEICDTPVTSFRTRVTDETLQELVKRHFRPSETSLRPFHIALMDMVGSSAAEFQWIPVKWIDQLNPLSCHPNLWDRRKLVFDDETLSQLLLVSPALTECDAWYLRHSYYVCTKCEAGHAYRNDVIYLPVTEVRTTQGNSSKLGQILQDAHKLADWVISCDGMLTKKQIAYNQNLVIRCKRSSSESSVIISSSASADSLNVMIKDQLEDLGKQNVRPDINTVRKKLFKEALTISGYIGLRAAKNPTSASELIGLCLSKHILADMINRECARSNESLLFSAYLMLDDYASWFNSKSDDHTIADIISFGVARDAEQKLCLHILIAESKYRSSLADTKHSIAQLRNTVEKILRFLSDEENFGIENSLGLNVWLNRFANMIIDADITPVPDSDDFYHYLNLLRKGEVRITINGFSHYFAYDQLGVSALRKAMVGDIFVYQQIFDKNDTLRLMETLATSTSPQSVVESVDPEAASAYCFLEVPRQFKIHNSQIYTSWEKQPLAQPIQGTNSIEFQSLKTEEQPSSPDNVDLETQINSEQNETSLSPGKYGKALTALIEREIKPRGYSQTRMEWCDISAAQLRQGLAENGISVKELRHIPTPNGCLVVYQGSNELGQKPVQALKDRLLMTRKLRIGFTEPAPGEFRIFLESDEREAVPMWNLWKDREIRRNSDGSNTSLAIAFKELDGSILYLDPMSKMNEPHTLIAGSTGSGKSVLMRMMLLDIAATNTPEQAKIYIIDPKIGVDYGPLRRLPHLASPLITDQQDALNVLDEIISEMERRYHLFSDSGNENLIDYNVTHPDEKLPFIWLIHDEFPQWMIDPDYNQAVTPKIKSLATKARAAGIYLILLAQRPDKDVVPMQIRDNLGNRLALKLPSEASSKIALDMPGAESLLGQGHLAAKIGSIVTFAQCPFLSRSQTEAAVKAIIADYENQ